MNLYAMKDMKAQLVSAPFGATNDGVACRMVMESLRDAQSTIAKYPADFELIAVGEYDEHTGALGYMDVRKVVSVATLAESMRAS